MMKRKTRFDWICIVLALGIVLCSLGIIGLLCGISDKANAISAIIGMVGMVMTYSAARYTPKRPAR